MLRKSPIPNRRSMFRVYDDARRSVVLVGPQFEELSGQGVFDDLTTTGLGNHRYSRIVVQLKAVARQLCDAVEHVFDAALTLQCGRRVRSGDRPALMYAPQQVILVAFAQPVTQ